MDNFRIAQFVIIFGKYKLQNNELDPCLYSSGTG